MKICLVTTFPPSQGGLSEYGLHIAQELRRNPFIRLTVLADKISLPEPELEGYWVRRCWSFDDPASSIHILNAIRKLKPDVVWFNLLFSTFGRNPLIAFAGLLTPVLSRLTGCYTHVTLHHLMDTVDLKDAGVRHARTYRLAGAVATKMLLMSNSVSVLMPGYRKILHEKYGRDNVHLRSHGPSWMSKVTSQSGVDPPLNLDTETIAGRASAAYVAPSIEERLLPTMSSTRPCLSVEAVGIVPTTRPVRGGRSPHPYAREPHPGRVRRTRHRLPCRQLVGRVRTACPAPVQRETRSARRGRGALYGHATDLNHQNRGPPWLAPPQSVLVPG